MELALPAGKVTAPKAYQPSPKGVVAEAPNENVAPAPVLANFQTSGFVLAYGQCPIVLHPKFESPGIREKVEQYGLQMFKGTERSLRNWADRSGACYLVYSLGEFATSAPELQMRTA